ncbi:hypothetical protein NNJEOMEG_01209 [Fundidesulfovibrio magnetotacticus]|uniref:Uncharacterized protein n=1 Tax=Fundidesulfovibrio magnetotacticus TaxID=2730080 RepID=A0A6V8LUP4_9BACT|nr:SxtJ family membrane protein [Fundidesulfovibrio magnetotacticus]GFK93377.1 hypothetical protein NNJEOMEG_01209 [Fundidesulfovibrio magnetotacticus]
MSNQSKKGSFWLSATRAQARDTGMALVLVCLLAAWFTANRTWLGVGILLLVLDMTWPSAFKVPAKLWLGLAHALGTVMSKLLLSVVFFTVLTPMGLLRRAMGKDSMQVRRFKSGPESVFRERGHTFTAADIETPY